MRVMAIIVCQFWATAQTEGGNKKVKWPNGESQKGGRQVLITRHKNEPASKVKEKKQASGEETIRVKTCEWASLKQCVMRFVL